MTHWMMQTDFASHLNSIPESHVQISHLNGGLVLIGICFIYSLSNAKVKALTEHAVIPHFSHGNEGQLIEDTKALSDGSELQILGDDNVLKLVLLQNLWDAMSTHSYSRTLTQLWPTEKLGSKISTKIHPGGKTSLSG
jgi:hypothetical protein